MNVEEVPAKSAFGTGGGFGGSGGLRISTSDTTVQHNYAAPSTFRQQPPSTAIPASSTGTSAGDCHYFLQGTCSKGGSCHFRHNPTAKASGTVCRFWQSGFCKDDANCSFQHPATGRGHTRGGHGGRYGGGRGMGGGRGTFAGGRGNLRPSPLGGVDRSTLPCVFFAQGKCTKGDACPFSHAAQGMGSNAGADAATSKPPDSFHALQRADISRGRVQVNQEEAQSACMTSCSENGIPLHRNTIGESGTGGSNLATELRGVNSGQNQQDSDLVSDAAPRSNKQLRHGDAFGSMPFATGPPVVRGADGATYVLGPDGPVPLEAVVRTMGAGQATGVGGSAPRKGSSPDERQGTAYGDRNDQGRRLHPENKVSSQGGIIAMPDGGFMTRKRAAELQVGDSRCSKQIRQIQQRETMEQESTRERTSGNHENKPIPTGSRGSIMDRLGPARPLQGRGTVAERSTGLVQSRVEAAAQISSKRDETRQHSSPIERRKSVVHTLATSTLSRSQALASGRQTRRPDAWRAGGVVSVDGGLARPNATAKSTGTKTSTALNFTVPTLDEIKSRKAKSQGSGAVPAKANVGEKNIEHKGQQPTTKAQGTTPESGLPARTPSPSYKEAPSDNPAPPFPASTVQPSEQQLYAADMDEFSEWL